MVHEILLNMIYATLISCGIMTPVFFVALKINNFSIVDIAWSYMFSIVALFYYLTLPALTNRKLILFIMVLFWSLRLGTHLLLRIIKEHPHEEGRYLTLRSKWKDRLKLNFFIFFIAQGISVSFLALPILIAMSETAHNPILIFEKSAFLLWICAIVGESISDAQLKNFKSKPENKGKVCDVGLWGYSRHPNYFFEWLIWVSFAWYAWNGPFNYLAWISPAIILYLLFKVTGIPATEKQSIKSKGQAYIDYQNKTSAFIPWFKKK